MCAPGVVTRRSTAWDCRGTLYEWGGVQCVGSRASMAKTMRTQIILPTPHRCSQHGPELMYKTHTPRPCRRELCTALLPLTRRCSRGRYVRRGRTRSLLLAQLDETVTFFVFAAPTCRCRCSVHLAHAAQCAATRLRSSTVRGSTCPASPSSCGPPCPVLTSPNLWRDSANQILNKSISGK
jgi:hypothetical protein